MNTRFRLIFRGVRGGMYYCVDKHTGKRTSLQTTSEDEARQIIEAKNIAIATGMGKFKGDTKEQFCKRHR